MPCGYHTLLLSNEGLLAFGGKPGLFPSDEKMPDVPHQVPWVGPPLVKVDWGQFHSLALDSKGGVWEAGTSGVPNREFTSNFRLVEGLPEITQIAAGHDHSAAIDNEGCLWVWWGKPDHQRVIPKQIPFPSKISKAACGWGKLILECEDGTLWIYHPFGETMTTPIFAKDLSSGPLRSLCILLYDAVFVDAEGSVFLCRIFNDRCTSFTFRKLEIPPVVEASSGFWEFLLLDEKRQLWKHKRYPGEVGETSLWLEEVSSFVSGGRHFMAHLLDGRTMMFGDNSWGQFGPGSPSGYHNVPILCPYQIAFSSRQKSARFVSDQSDRESLPASS